MKTSIIVNLQFEGIHNWPNAFEEVNFLKNPHRHMFHVCAKKQVSHDDRQIEFIDLKRKMLGFVKSQLTVNLGPQSCEMLAKRFLQTFDLDYCSVLEDGENGAEVCKT